MISGFARALWLTALCTAAFAQSEETATFRADTRLIEIYATVTDGKGRFVDGLSRDHFEVHDNGQPVPISVFETGASDLSCALLLDTTGSMEKVLPVLKNAAVRMIDRLQPNDAVAVYSFSNSLSEVADFTTNKAAAKRALLRTMARGNTALFDGIAQAVERLSHRRGRKALIVFTDGRDNASVLSASASVARARRAGVPVFAIALGGALDSRDLFTGLESLSKATGGQAWAAKNADDLRAIFDAIATQLPHIYLLAYAAPPSKDSKWRPIRVRLRNGNYQVRAREGYFPD